METLSLPVRYEALSDIDVQKHLRHSANKLQHGERIEVLLCQAGVVIPLVKHLYRSRAATFDVLLRSGSIDRDRLKKVHEYLLAESYDLRVSHTSKRKMLQRVVVRLPIDGTITTTGLKVLQSVNDVFGFKWPTSMAIGYAVSAQERGLPGRVSFREPFYNAGYQVGNAAGRLLKKILRDDPRHRTSA